MKKNNAIHRIGPAIQIIAIRLAMIAIPATATAQYNCSIYKDSSEARACRLYNAIDSFYQGSPKCQHYLDSATTICPTFAPAWHEKSVPYLKRGDFATWRLLLDKAVALDSHYLAYRGWCRYEFLRDYAGALQDLRKYDTLTGFYHMTSNNGDYELHIVMALCERALGHDKQALAYFETSFGADSTQAGLYGYLYLGTTRLKTKDYHGAIAALEHENRVYDKFAETWYYLAKVNLALGNQKLAKEQLQQAKSLLTDPTGRYYIHDPYCEKEDAVYLEDVDAALAGLGAG